MTSAEIRQSFLKFFEERGHAIVPSSPVVPYEDPTLLFTNAGMNQFKDVFLGTGKRSYTRAADTQKCIRVSGKHNDLEEVGRDTYHHTMFEMLGNWSFGDYYKKEAIAWGWELLTKVWGLPKERMWATVYKNDDEAFELWKTQTDIDPAHILRFGEKENFWEMGETGPCGPCSEIHYDRTPGGTCTASMVNAGTPDCIEIWNLVFIQYNRDAAGTLHPLPSKHVDTGMGFERICAVMQNKPSNYDTDVFMPLLHTLEKLTGKPYSAQLDNESDISFRVIADHIRALTFAIGDGALPSNEGRGYVLRRILRRAARFGRTLGMREPFIYRAVPALVETMSSIFPEIRQKQEFISKVIRGEEEGFNATLDRGLEIFEEVVASTVKRNAKTLAGDDVFKLYDTYGFPLDLTALMARERGFDVDEARFTQLMEEQRERSRESRTLAMEQGGSAEEAAAAASKEKARALETEKFEPVFTFTGYTAMRSDAEILDTRDNLVVLNRTPFYGESGGQVGDKGTLTIGGKPCRVLDTQKSGNVHVHVLEHPVQAARGTAAEAHVDEERRRQIMGHHSATHLLHKALRTVLGTHVHQAGSLVAPDHLRFDFSHFAKVSDAELKEIEALVNGKIDERLPLHHHLAIPFDEAKKMGALMFFGDKYGDRVNVVQFGDYSMEFCGGTHVSNTGDIGFFKFRSEGSVASGTRRIEAVTGPAAMELLRVRELTLGERIEYASAQYQALTALAAEFAANAGKPAAGADALAALEQKLAAVRAPARDAGLTTGLRFAGQSERMGAVEDLVLAVAEMQKSIEKELGKLRMQSLSGGLDAMLANAVAVGSIRVVADKVTVSSNDELKTLGDSLRSKLGSGAGVLCAVLEDKAALVCVVTDDLAGSKKLEAGKVVGAVAKLLGGGGGGRPHLATAGGKDITKIDEALAAVPDIVKSMLK